MSVALKFRRLLEAHVTEHRSLDEFAGGTDDSEDDETAVEERVSVVEPARATSRYEPDGVACPGCGAAVVRLWVVDDDVVCADCKSW